MGNHLLLHLRRRQSKAMRKRKSVAKDVQPAYHLNQSFLSADSAFFDSLMDRTHVSAPAVSGQDLVLLV